MTYGQQGTPGQPGGPGPQEAADGDNPYWSSYGSQYGQPAVPQQRADEPAARAGQPARGAAVAVESGPAGPAETAGPTEPTEPEGTGAEPAAEAKPKPRKPGRDRYLDLLRSIALVRVVVYHLFGWAWLTILFPSMGVMFALAGSLMARSLNRPAWGVIRGRLRRLLPPMWVFSAVALPMLFVAGWNPGKDSDLGGGALAFVELINYVIPIGAPPYPWTIGSVSGLLEPTWAVQAIGPLWYLRAYLWFVIASPLLLWAFRRVPWVTLFAPLALAGVLGSGLVKIPGETGNAVTDFAVYGSCWVLGFAHHEGMLTRIPRYLVVSCSALIMAFGLWWASGHLGPDGWDLNDIPLAQATWSFGFVVILLVYSPSWQELPGRLARWDKLVTLSNNRAVTIYLWHNALIMATIPLIDQVYGMPFMEDEGLASALSTTYQMWMFVIVWPLIGLMILAVGWIEDLAAKRSPRLWPDGSQRKGGRRQGSRRKG